MGSGAPRADRGLPPRRPLVRSSRGGLPDQRHDRRRRATRPPRRSLPRALSRVSPRHLRTLPAAGCRASSGSVLAAASERAPGFLAGQDVRLGRRRAVERVRVVRLRDRHRHAAAPGSVARPPSVRRRRAHRRADCRLLPALRERRRLPARSRQPAHGHGRPQGHGAPALARRIRARLLDASRDRRVLLRQRVRHDRALLAALRERAARPLRRPQPRGAAARGSALDAHPRARPRHAGARRRRSRRPALPSRPRQRGVGVGRAVRGPRACRRRRRDRGDRPRPRRAATRLRHAAGGPGTVREFGVLPRAIEAAPRAAAAAGWRHDAEVSRRLPLEARLSPAVVSAGVDATAQALDADAMVALVDRELGSERPVRPWLVAHVLASNVPALAGPAIALGCLAGAAVLVKSGRADRVSGPAFRRALEAEDGDLAATVVTAYWAGGDLQAERTLLAHADVVVLTGRDATVDAIARRLDTRVITHGERTSVAVIGRDAVREADTIAQALAEDVALHDQRGCLSPVAVYVEHDAGAFAERLAAALDAVGIALPPGPLEPDERAAHRAAVAEAEWTGATVLGGARGTVLVDATSQPRPSPGRRTVWVQPLSSLADVLPAGRIECVGVAGAVVDAVMLRRLGVSRVCAPGRMQRPPLAWPRGQLAPLRTLLALPAEPRLEVESA